MNTRRWLDGRRPFAIIAIVCIGLLAYAYYAEFVLGLEPCPLCMLQRFGFMGMLVFALIALVHAPGKTGRRLYALPMMASGVWGLTTAYRHVWLQGLPEDEVPDCGPGIEFMQAYGFSWMEILSEAFTGAGQCAEIDWTFIGLSMPHWTLIWYLGVLVFLISAVVWGRSTPSN